MYTALIYEAFAARLLHYRIHISAYHVSFLQGLKLTIDPQIIHIFYTTHFLPKKGNFAKVGNVSQSS